MAGKPLAHRGTGGTSLTSEDDAVPDIDTNNVCEGAKFLMTTLMTRSWCRLLDCYLRDCRVSFLYVKFDVARGVGPMFSDFSSTAWKHACGYLESYISATEKVHKAHAKEYEKILKVGAIIEIPNPHIPPLGTPIY